jgi:uncharacterized protein YndB with AHSA1/START domain
LAAIRHPSHARAATEDHHSTADGGTRGPSLPLGSGLVRELVRQEIDWIERAPVALTATGTTSAAPEAVFAVLADHERWPEWFPNVKKVDVMGPAEGVGARRRVHVPGLVVEEEFIVWDPGVRWAFTGTAAKPGFVRSIVEDCRLTPTASGGTDLSYTMYLEPTGVFRPLTRMAGGLVRSSIRRALVGLVARAEAR